MYLSTPQCNYSGRRVCGVNNAVDKLLLEIADDDVARHCWRVAELSGDLSSHMGLSAETATLATLSGVLHDIGKRSIPKAVLDKPGPLTDAEWVVMKTHPIRGYEMILGEVHPDVADTVRSHHERFDGRGYPRGLAGQAIPVAARVLLVADAYDAMTTVRPYQGAMPWNAALTELRMYAGYQFDPDVVEAMVDMVKESQAVFAA